MAVRSIIRYECVHVIGWVVACETGAVIAAICVVTLGVIATDFTQLTLIFICIKTYIKYKLINQKSMLSYCSQDNQTLAVSPPVADKSIHAVAHFSSRSVSFIITGGVLMARGTNIHCACLHSYI